MSDEILIVVEETVEEVSIEVSEEQENLIITVNDSADKYYRYNQYLPAAVWYIRHNMSKRPSVTVTDSAGTVVIGQVEYVDENNVIVTFSAAFSGYAELN